MDTERRTFTRIVATLGPASAHKDVLARMNKCGMDVVRLNFSHGDHDSHAEYINVVKDINKDLEHPIEILADLEGPRIRIGSLPEPLPLEIGDQISLITESRFNGEQSAVPIDFDGSFETIHPGQGVFVDDGNIVLVVEKAGAHRLETRVEVGGLLKKHKGVNIPGVWIDFPILSDKDIGDIKFALSHKVDYLAQSFVRGKQDMLAIADCVSEQNAHVKLIAKIENRDGIKNSDKILEAAEGIMVARGDMGVTLPIWEVPMIQKELIRKCNRRKKLVITATQMLESMVEKLRPTRAEVTDVANAIIDGTDFVMLSAETAVGRYPVETVQMMNRICEFTEDSIRYADI